MYTRYIRGREFTFDFAAGLINDNLLIVDRETDSVWSQLEGRAIAGPMAGAPLPVMVSMQTTWKFWRNRYPETRVMIVKGEEGRPYLYRNRRPGAPRPTTSPSTHDTSTLGLGLTVEDQAIFFPFVELEKSEVPFRLTMRDRTIVVHYSREGLTAWATDSEDRILPGIVAYRDGWMDFNPESIVYSEPPTR